MARRKKGPIEDLIDLSARLPWWACAILAVLSYSLFNYLAEAEITSLENLSEIGQNFLAVLIKAFAGISQYLFPIIFLFGAGLSVLGRIKRSQLIAGVREQGADASVLNGISWQEFEMLVGEAYRRRGYSVTETGGGGADGGIDLVLARDGKRILVQCKQWKSWKVSVSVVRELFGLMASQGAVGGIVVTSGSFTSEAQSFASNNGIELIDGPALTRMIREVRTQGGDIEMPADAQKNAVTAPQCPVCGRQMAKRVARHGVYAGKSFWGCTGYPKCRGTQPVVS